MKHHITYLKIKVVNTEYGFATCTNNGLLDWIQKRVFAKGMHISIAVQIASCATVSLDGGSFKMEHGYWQRQETFRSCAIMKVSCVKYVRFDFETYWFLSLADFKDRILITGGTRNIKTEVHDIKRPHSICNSKEFFKRYGAVGGILENKNVVCGGKSSKLQRYQNCTVIGEEQGKEVQMMSKRYAASSVVVGNYLWITGCKTLKHK